MGTSDGTATAVGFVDVGAEVVAVDGALLCARDVTLLGMLRKLLALPAMTCARLLFIK